MALAFVLGTIGRSDPVLLRVLAHDPDEGVLRCVLLALGATREPADDDEVFGLGARPWGADGPHGLGITVRRAIDDVAVRRALAGFLDHAAPTLRQAAAESLRHSLDAADARDAFRHAFAGEEADDVALPLGEGLAVWAAGTDDATERADVVRTLVARAADERLEGYRFRIEDDLGGMALGPEELAALREYAHPSQPLGLRAFALTVLATGADRGGPDAAAEARRLLERTAQDDPDRAARDLAARLLGRLPWTAASGAVLAGLAREAPEWSVRFSALEALAGFGARPEVLAALDAARADPDARVAARAAELHDRLAAQ